jgi:alpha,alpha-trehalose phosphorylase
MDLKNLERNTRDGLHIASLAGAWIVAVAGFGGMRDHDGAMSFAPRLPQRLTRLAFGICFRDRRLRVEVTHDQAQYSLLQGPPLQITHHGERINVTTDQPVMRRSPRSPQASLQRNPRAAARNRDEHPG